MKVAIAPNRRLTTNSFVNMGMPSEDWHSPFRISPQPYSPAYRHKASLMKRNEDAT